MLAAYPVHDAGGLSTSLSAAAWVDLVEPSAAECADFEKTSGLRVPAKEELSEIAATSRLHCEKDALYMTAPLIFAGNNEPWIFTPTGFVLSKKVLLTVRYAHPDGFAPALRELDGQVQPMLAYVRILEQMVGHLADLLETTSLDLDDASHVIFRASGRRRLSRETKMLRRLMIRTGRTSERMTRLHYTLVCLDRMTKFTADRAHEWIGPDNSSRLQSVSSDIASLVQFTEALVSRVQLLQDAATGIINIDQNDVMKVLTIASVAGIPPVLVVGIYGMNFKYMPEYDWSFGYPYALAMIVLTTLVPLLWFKWKDWI